MMPATAEMNCESLDRELDQLIGPRKQPSGEAQRHLEQCSRCRALHAALLGDSPRTPVPVQLERRILSVIGSSLKPVKPLASAARIAVTLIAAFLLVAAVISSRIPFAGLRRMSGLQLIVASGLLTLGVLTLAIFVARDLRPAALRRIPAWLASSLFPAALVIGFALAFPWKTPENFLPRGFQCLSHGLIMSLPAALAFGFIVRRGAPLNLKSLGATLGALAGLLGMAILQFTCELQDAVHLLIWHAGVVLVAALIGWLITPRLFEVLD